MHLRHSADMHPLHGFTLVELMIGLTLIGILLTWGVPSFVNLYQRTQLAAQTGRLASDLYHARSEAIKRNLPVVICRSENSSSCAQGGSSHSDWGIGWITFVNKDDDKVRDPDEDVIRIGASVPKTVSLHFNRWWRLTFQPSGRAGNGTFTLCDPEQNQRKIVVFLSGRTRISRQRNASKGCPES